MNEEINLRNIKLVSFETKSGVYVYQNNKLIGTILGITLIDIIKGE